MSFFHRLRHRSCSLRNSLASLASSAAKTAWMTASACSDAMTIPAMVGVARRLRNSNPVCVALHLCQQHWTDGNAW